MMCHAKTAQKEIVETIEWRPRKKINCLSPSFGGLFFILKETHDNIKEMHLFRSFISYYANFSDESSCIGGEYTNAIIMYVIQRRVNMIYKVYYQENKHETPVRENTKTLYVEASSEREVRAYLKERNYNIELVQLLEGNYLEYEQASPNFRLENA